MAVRDDLIIPLRIGLRDTPSEAWSANQALGYLQAAVDHDVAMQDVVDTLMDGIRAGVIEYTADGYRLSTRNTNENPEGATD